MSIWLERFLRRGWRFVPFKAGGDNSGRRRKIRCPQPGCGLCLTVDTSAAVTKSADAVESVVELSMVLANRRNRLGLTSDDIDHCAGLGARHVQKLEDAGRLSGMSGAHSQATILYLLAKLRESGKWDYEAETLLDGMIAGRAAALEGALVGRPGAATIDTILLVVGALGGKIKIEWGEPPAVTRRLVEMSGRDRQLPLPW